MKCGEYSEYDFSENMIFRLFERIVINSTIVGIMKFVLVCFYLLYCQCFFFYHGTDGRNP